MAEVNYFNLYDLAKRNLIKNKFNEESTNKFKVTAQKLYDHISIENNQGLWLETIEYIDGKIARILIEQLGDKIISIDFLHRWGLYDILEDVSNRKYVQQIFKNKEQGHKYIIGCIKSYENYSRFNINITRIINHMLCLLLEENYDYYTNMLLEIGFSMKSIELIVKSKSTYYFIVGTESSNNLMNHIFGALTSQLPSDMIDSFMTHTKNVEGDDILKRMECNDASWYKKLSYEYQIDISPFYYIIRATESVYCCCDKNTLQRVIDTFHIQDPLLKQIYESNRRQSVARNLIIDYLSTKFNVNTRILEIYARMNSISNIAYGFYQPESYDETTDEDQDEQDQDDEDGDEQDQDEDHEGQDEEGQDEETDPEQDEDNNQDQESEQSDDTEQSDDSDDTEPSTVNDNYFTRYHNSVRQTKSKNYDIESLNEVKLRAEELYQNADIDDVLCIFSETTQQDNIKIVVAMIEQVGDRIFSSDFLFRICDDDILTGILGMEIVQKVIKNEVQAKKFILENIISYKEYRRSHPDGMQVLNHLLFLFLKHHSIITNMLIGIGFTTDLINAILNSEKDCYYFSDDANLRKASDIFNKFVSNLQPDLFDSFMLYIQTSRSEVYLKRMECSNTEWYRKIWYKYQIDMSPICYIIATTDDKCVTDPYSVLVKALHIRDQLFLDICNEEKPKRKTHSLKRIMIGYLRKKFSIDSIKMQTYVGLSSELK